MLYTEDIRSLPLPSPDQHARFVEHLVYAHSWYRHIPLFEPATFVVFLARDAGQDYPIKHPSLPFGNTTEGYRRAFGYLDYMWLSCGYWSRDCGHSFPDGETEVILSDELLKTCSFSLFPYVQPGDDDCFLHQENLSLVLSGQPHPAGWKLEELAQLKVKLNDIWNNGLTSAERDAICDSKAYSVEEPERCSMEVLRYIELQKEFRGVLMGLMTGEVAKIEVALRKLYQWCQR